MGAAPHLKFDAHVAPQERLPEAIDGVIRWKLFPRAGGTLLVLTFRGLSKPVATLFAGRLKGFLARLEAQLDGHPLPGWEPKDGKLRGRGSRPSGPDRT